MVERQMNEECPIKLSAWEIKFIVGLLDNEMIKSLDASQIEYLVNMKRKLREQGYEFWGNFL